MSEAGQDWTPWGRPRASESGIETAFHHPLILIRVGKGRPQVVAPGEAFVGGGAEIEWSPMPWALRGRRHWRPLRSEGPESVFRGRSDRLYLAADALNEQLFEGGLLGPRSLAAWTRTLNKRIDFCEQRGVAYRHLIIPEGAAITAEDIAGAPKLSPDRPLMQLLRAGGDRLRERLIYPLQALIDGRAQAETSYPHDVHMTGYGSFLCYRELMARLTGVDPASLVREDELRVRQTLVAGDLARRIEAPARRVDFHAPPQAAFKEILKGTSHKTNQVDVFEGDNANLPRLTLFRTSNSTHLLTYLMRHFSRIAAVATTEFHYDLVASERPHVVLCEMPERYLAISGASANETDRGSPPSDGENTFELRTGHKLPLP